MVRLQGFTSSWDWHKVPGTAHGDGIYAAENGYPKVWVPGKLYGNIKALEYAVDCFYKKKEPDWTIFLPFYEAYPWHKPKNMINFNGDNYSIEYVFFEGKDMGYAIFKNNVAEKYITMQEADTPDETILQHILGRQPIGISKTAQYVGNYEPVREGEEKPLYTLSYPQREFINMDTSSNAWMGKREDDGTEKSGCLPIIGWTMAAILFFTALIYFLSK